MSQIRGLKWSDTANGTLCSTKNFATFTSAQITWKKLCSGFQGQRQLPFSPSQSAGAVSPITIFHPVVLYFTFSCCKYRSLWGYFQILELKGSGEQWQGSVNDTSVNIGLRHSCMAHVLEKNKACYFMGCPCNLIQNIALRAHRDLYIKNLPGTYWNAHAAEPGKSGKNWVIEEQIHFSHIIC